ncbi:MAG TPA: NUDIX domain-containing protein [Gemmatimonadaceae bacterium]|jgi:ADP-ribose pyrophosphatase YjhB (NUDIX family)
MEERSKSIEFLGSDADAYVPHLAVDCVVFGFHGGALKLLLTHWQRRRRWSLPGGFVRRTESLDDAARRVLRMRTGLRNSYLEQFHTFGHPRRGDARIAKMFDAVATESPAPAWMRDRIISVGYYALVDWSEVTPTADGILTDDCRWWNLASHPPLLFDHDEMVQRALAVLRSQLAHRPIGLNLFPEQFTLPELQRLYESILGRTLDRRNFQKKMLDSGTLERVGQRRGNGIRRAPYLYRFDRERYGEVLTEGMWVRR